MSRCNSGEQDTTASLYLPPKPSCRRPLSRMVKRFGTLEKHALSSSPDNYRRNNSDEPEISEDENDEENSDVDRDSEEDDVDGQHLVASEQTENQDSVRQRFSPSGAFTTVESQAADRPSRTSPRRSRDHRDSSAIPRNSGKDAEKESARSYLPLGIFLLVVGGLLYRFVGGGLYLFGEETRANDRRDDFQANVRRIRRHFPSQDSRIWSDIAAGVIEVTGGASEPWIFVLYSNETKELACLARLLGDASSNALHTEGSLQLYPKDLSDDYGLVIERLEPEISAKKAVVVYDVLNINPQAIQAFHTMCDRIKPLVEGVVYILTILTSGNIPEFQKPVDFIESQLTNRFVNKVPEEKLQPLITRITDGPLIPVRSEISLTKCPL